MQQHIHPEISKSGKQDRFRRHTKKNQRKTALAVLRRLYFELLKATVA
jgi:hypothetical protein